MRERTRASASYNERPGKRARCVVSLSDALTALAELLDQQDARGKKKKTHTPFIPSFARQTKAAQKASTSATTLDDEGSPGPPKKKRKKEFDPALFIPQRESSRKSAVAFKKTIEGRLKESEQRRVSSRIRSSFWSPS